MFTFAEFLEFLTALLGDDHALVASLTEANSAGDTDDARWAAVSDEALGQLADELRTAAGDDDIDISELAAIADRLDEVAALADARFTAAEEDATARAALLERISNSDTGDGDDDGTDDGDDSGDDSDDGADDAAADDAAGADQQPEPVNAGGGRTPRQPSLARTNARRSHRSAPTPPPAAADVTVRLADNFGDHGRGAELSLEQFGDALLRATRDNRGTYRGTPQKLRVGTVRHELPEARQLTGNVAQNSERVAALQREARQALANAEDNAARVAALTQPLTAAGGGLCAPVTPYYPVQTLGDDLRDVADFVMRMQADRGGITFVPPPSFVDGWGADLADGVAEWTMEDDAFADDPSFDPETDGKPCAVLDCDDPVTVVIEAITKCIEISNIRAMTYREQIDAALHYLSMHHARVAETALLVGSVDRPGIARLTDETVTFDGALGASREVPRAFGTAAAALRDQFRMSDSETLDVLLPHWVPAAMTLDVAAALAGGSTDEQLAFSETAIGRAFLRHNLRVGYFRDTQNFTDSGAFPGAVSGYLFPPGTFMMLDDPELDLGIVRDSALNGRNRFRYFAESFEAIAKVGVVARQVTLTNFCLNGGQAGTIDPADVDCLTVS